jgi:hypothetical protein
MIRKFILSVMVLLFVTVAPPAQAKPNLWICLADPTILYLIVDNDSHGLTMFDEHGVFIGATSLEKMHSKTTGQLYFTAQINDLKMIVVPGTVEQGVLFLALSSDKGKIIQTFECE